MNRSTSDSIVKKSYTTEEIQTWLVSRISEQLGVKSSEIDIRTPLDNYDLDSIEGMILASEAENWLGIKLPIIALWHYPTIEALAKRLAEECEASDSETFQI